MLFGGILVSLASFVVATRAAVPAPSGPPPKIALTVSTVSPKQWTMRLENSGEVPLRIVADAGLISLEITAPAVPRAGPKGARAGRAITVRCSLPADMRPSNDMARGVVLLPGKAYAESFDPRMYCFGARESEGLVRGARMVAHYGFSSPRAGSRSSKPQRLSPPFVVSPVLEVDAKSPETSSADSPTNSKERVAPLKEVIASSAIELSGDDVTTSANVADAADGAQAPPHPSLPPEREGAHTEEVATRPAALVSGEGDALAPKLVLSMPARTDSARGSDLSVSPTLMNVGSREASVYFRPQAVAFEVTGPGGDFTCAATGVGAIRELFTTLAPRGQAQISVLPSASCPAGAFDLPGLYDVRPRLDTTRILGSPPALHAFQGELAGTPGLVRVRAGKRELSRPPPMAE